MPIPSPLRQATSLFHDRFASRPSVGASAPGRINLLGEHTDYNGGPVLPFAIERRTAVVGSIADAWQAVSTLDSRLRSFSPEGEAQGDWTDYPRAIARLLLRRGLRLPGARLAVASSIPSGAGLSSSSALALATARSLALLGGLRLSPGDLIDIAWRAEHDEMGIPCGRMDQTVIALAERGSALLIECGSGALRSIPLPGKVWVFETGVTHALGDSEYPVRRKQCEEVLSRAHEREVDAGSLAALSAGQFHRILPWLPPPLDRRGRHVITETARTRRAVAALAQRDLVELGRLMFEGHESLRLDYESSCPEADHLVESIRSHGGLGARLTGGGWGGAVVALLPDDRSARIAAEVGSDFKSVFGREIVVWATRAVAGVRREQVD